MRWVIGVVLAVAALVAPAAAVAAEPSWAGVDVTTFMDGFGLGQLGLAGAFGAIVSFAALRRLLRSAQLTDE